MSYQPRTKPNLLSGIAVLAAFIGFLWYCKQLGFLDKFLQPLAWP